MRHGKSFTAQNLILDDSHRRLRIAVFSYWLPSPGNKRGGVDRVAHDLAQGLAKRGHEVTVWTFDRRPTGARYRVERLPGERWATSWLGKRVTMGALGNLLAFHPGFRDCDAILAHSDSLLLPIWRKPVVRVMHGSALYEALASESMMRRVLHLGLYAQELVTALTQRGSVGVSQNSRRPNPFLKRAIPNGIDLSVFRPGKRKSRHPSILFVGSLYGRKRGMKLVEWFWSQIRPRHPLASLWMVSQPGPRLPGVRYFPAVNEKQLVKLYQRAWIYASPSRYEGFGLPYIEAMACGTPVLAAINPGSREILSDGHYGLLATDATFAKTLDSLISGNSERESLAARGLQRAREFDLNSTLDQYEVLLHELCVDSSFPHRLRNVKS